MNILLLTYQGDIAGSTLSITYLAKGLAKRGHNVYVGCREESLLHGYFTDSNVTVLPMTFKSKLDFENARQIKEAVEKYKIQVVNAQSSYDRYTSIIAKKVYKIKAKLVFTRRQVSRSVGGLQSVLYQWGADHFVAVGESIKASLINDGIKTRSISVINNGTPEDKYLSMHPSKTKQLREGLNIAPDNFVIGCISRLKKQSQLLEALDYIDFPTTVIFVGIDSVPDFDLKSIDNKHRIIFAGKTTAMEALDYYPMFDVKVLSSTMEGLSQSLLEAMYLEIPVIATAAAGNLDLIKDNENGLLFPDNDTAYLAQEIERVYSDENLRSRLITNGKQTATVDFSIEKTLDGYERLFANLLDE